MASSNKPTGVHFTLIFAFMAIIVLSLTTYFGYSGKGEAEVKATEAQNKEAETARALATATGDLNKSMELLGADRASYPAAEEGIKTAMQKLGVNQEKQTVLASLEALRSAYDSANAENLTLKNDLQTTRNEILRLQSDYQGRVDQSETSKKASEALVQEANATKDEIVQQRDVEITQLKGDLQSKQVELLQLQDLSVKTEESLNNQIKLLTSIVNSQRQEIEEIQKTSFEVADGAITEVDANQRIVFINLGEMDNLRPQISFSVYSRDHRGIGREARDIKGEIEVTRVLGPHLSVARILKQDRARPISEGDPIYSPIWAGGRKEFFSFVGLIDFDNDGRSDREALHRILEGSNAAIEIEVDDDGQRTPPDAKISVDSKFLVFGRIPDASNFAAGDERRLKAEAMMAQREALMAEALAAGVRTVKLDDFLAYMGYRPKQRIFVPGGVDKYTLEQGARGASIRSDSPASGQNSKLFDRMKRQDETGIKQFRN